MNMSVKRNRSFSSSRVAFAALGLSVLTACGGGQGGMKMGDNQFAVEAVKATSSNQSEQYPATIKGLQIDPTQYKAAYDQAAASVKSAKANLETITATERNKKMLHDQKIISDFEYQTAVNNLLTAKANLAQAEAAYTAAKQNLDFCTVKSPSDGVIGTFPYRIGALVSPSISEPLTTVSEIGDMYVYFSMTEKQLLDLTRAGGTLKEQLEKMPAVKLQLADGTMYDAEGKIDAVSGVIDQTTGSVSMRAIFPNKQNILRSGGMANVVFPYTMSEIILIPQTATQEIQDKKFVYVLQPDSTLKHTEIQISNLNDGKNYIVTGGLKEGDQIVVEGVQTLQDGQKISPITVAQKEAKYQQALQDQRDGNIQTAFN